MDIIHSNGLPVMNPLLPHILHSLCTDSHWVYAVFWRIQPRSYPPPKWDTENGFPRRSNTNKRNWILAWEDAFCDFLACSRNSRPRPHGYSDDLSSWDDARETLQPNLFFKMSHEIYTFGEGLMGKVAAENSHKWVHKEPPEHESSFLTSWHTNSLDSHPRTWEAQFQAGIETIALIAVQEGLVQLGSLGKIMEDFNFVLLLQRKFNDLQCMIPASLAPYPCRMQATSKSSSLPSRSTLSEEPALELKRKRVWDDDRLTDWGSATGSTEPTGGLNWRAAFEGYDAPHTFYSNNCSESANIPTSFNYDEHDQFMNSTIPATAVAQARSSLINSGSTCYDIRELPVYPPDPSKVFSTGRTFAESGITCRSSLSPSMSNLQALLSKLPPVTLPNQSSTQVVMDSPSFPINPLPIDSATGCGRHQAPHHYTFTLQQNTHHHNQAIRKRPHESEDDVNNEKVNVFLNTIEVATDFELQEDLAVDDHSYHPFVGETTS